jgi:hypothetical protein
MKHVDEILRQRALLAIVGSLPNNGSVDLGMPAERQELAVLAKHLVREWQEVVKQSDNI